MIECIGRGGTGIVYKVRHKETNKFFALKEISIVSKPEMAIRKEFMFGFSHNSENIVRSYEIYKYEGVYYIVQELMLMKLTKFLEMVKGDLEEKHICYVIKEILKGLEHIHWMNVIHRDLKSDNIFLNSSGDIKIGDFGEIEELTSEVSMRQTIIGTPYWMAPEVVSQTPYSLVSDIWSFGIILFEIAEKRLPYPKRPISEIFDKIVHEEPPKIRYKWSEGLKQLSSSCLQKNPNLRPSARSLLGMKCMIQLNKSYRKFILNIINQTRS